MCELYNLLNKLYNSHLLNKVQFYFKALIMTEDNLNKLCIDELFNLLMKSTKELTDFKSTQNEIEHDAKKNEVQLLQRIIVAKRAEFSPG